MPKRKQPPREMTQTLFCIEGPKFTKELKIFDECPPIDDAKTLRDASKKGSDERKIPNIKTKDRYF